MTIIEMAQLTGIQPKWVANTNGGEYHSSCPACGGTDRFFIQPCHQMTKCLGSYCCRRCGIYGDAIRFAQQFLNCSYKDAAEAANAIVPYQPWQSIFNKQWQPVALQKPHNKWIEMAKALVVQAHKHLLCSRNILDYLADRGLPREAVMRYKLGWVGNDQFPDRDSWGLPSSPDRSKLWIPRGILIPACELSGSVMRLKVRRCAWYEGDRLPKYVAISGSMNGMGLIGAQERMIIVVVESELDAYAVHHAIGDFVCVVAVGSNIKNPDNVTDHLARRVKHLLICYDNDEAGKKMYGKWRYLYSHAIRCPTPIGKDIGEAIQKGFDIREWFLTIVHNIKR